MRAASGKGRGLLLASGTALVLSILLVGCVVSYRKKKGIKDKQKKTSRGDVEMIENQSFSGSSPSQEAGSEAKDEVSSRKSRSSSTETVASWSTSRGGGGHSLIVPLPEDLDEEEDVEECKTGTEGSTRFVYRTNPMLSIDTRKFRNMRFNRSSTTSSNAAAGRSRYKHDLLSTSNTTRDDSSTHIVAADPMDDRAASHVRRVTVGPIGISTSSAIERSREETSRMDSAVYAEISGAYRSPVEMDDTTSRRI